MRLAMTQQDCAAQEAVIDPDRPIIDAHHHLYDVPGSRYLADEYRADVLLGHRIIASAYVETLSFMRVDGPSHLRPIGEIEFANGIGAMARAGYFGGVQVCAAVVGYADLREGDRVAELLDLAMASAPDRIRGMRQIALDHPAENAYRLLPQRPPRGLIESEAFRAGLRHFAPRGLSFDIAVYENQHHDLVRLVRAFPETTFILNHLGMAFGFEMSADRRAEVFAHWREGIRALGQCPNIICKIGGLGMPIWGFGFEEAAVRPSSRDLAAVWAPYVETASRRSGRSGA